MNAAKKSNKMIKKWPIRFDNMEVIGEINEHRMSSFLKVFSYFTISEIGVSLQKVMSPFNMQ